MKSTSYLHGYYDAQDNFIVKHYQPHGFPVYSGDLGLPQDYDEGYKDGWEVARKIDDMVE